MFIAWVSFAPRWAASLFICSVVMSMPPLARASAFAASLAEESMRAWSRAEMG